MKRQKTKQKERFSVRLKKDIKKNHWLYIMMILPLIYIIIFKYVPMYGVQIAFKDFKSSQGIWGSEWVGFEHFISFFNSYNFIFLMRNTLVISMVSILVGFPVTLIFALQLNYITSKRFKKALQMISYAPHFISLVVVCGMITIFLTPNTGIVNIFLNMFGLPINANYLYDPDKFLLIYVLSDLWQMVGWGSIIYVAALAGVDESLHEAAIIDGATKIKRIWYIDLPHLKPTIIVLLILRFGSIMDVGFQKVLLLQNSLNMDAADVISTYVYRVGLLNADYSKSTAINLFNSLINIVMLIVVNKIAKATTKQSLW